MTDIAKLIVRVEAATGPDRGLDGRIAWALGWRFNGGLEPTDHDWDEWPDCAGCWHQPGDTFPDINDKAGYRKGFAEGRWDDPPAYTASIDAALGLVERVLPGWGVTIVTDPPSACLRISTADSVKNFRATGYFTEEFPIWSGATPALAIIAALLRALSARSP